MLSRSLTLCAVLAVAGAASAQTAEAPPADDPVLARAYAEDQADGHRAAFVYQGGGAIPLDTLRLRLGSMPPHLADDVRRRLAVDSVLAAGGARTANDFYHAAMIHQHGADTTAYRMAHELAARAVALDPDHADARWLAAASWDRYLDASGRPQWYGTQYRCDDGGLRRSIPVEPGRVTDEERAAAGVETLAQQRALEGTPCLGVHHDDEDEAHDHR